ncbi:MAG: pullulanase, partial [Planctomycetota bacterium]
HKNDIRVILDVVYNHTATGEAQRAYDATVPGYFFRTTPDGKLRNDAGTGNSMADERRMVRKFIVDSLVFWAERYNVDGFRFDLLGTHQPETVDAIMAALGDVREDLTIYGEPWTGGGPIHFAKGQQKNTGMAVFNDHLRGAIRGGLDDATTGFATGPGGDPGTLLAGVRGAITDFTAGPTETVNYASAHDNLTLWDKIERANPNASEDEKIAMQKLALGIVLTSQGVPFLHGGSDFARTKGGEHNSYNKGDAVNKFDWDRKGEYLAMHDYVAGLIKLRREHPAFRLRTADDVLDSLAVVSTNPAVVYTLRGVDGEPWDEILVAYNGEPGAVTIDLPAGSWQQVVDADRAGTDKLRTVDGQLELPGYSIAVMHRGRP